MFYDYLRPHEYLDGRTPGEAAKVSYIAKTWADVIRQAKPHMKVLITPAVVDVLGERKPLVRPITHRRYDLDKKQKQRKALRKARARISKRTPRITPPTPQIGGMR